MADFAYYLISGICVGAIIALVAVGYTLVYGIIKLINFAHGEFTWSARMRAGTYLLLLRVSALSSAFRSCSDRRVGRP
jgi:branched-chain amino acid transport system permease protein